MSYFIVFEIRNSPTVNVMPLFDYLKGIFKRNTSGPVTHVRSSVVILDTPLLLFPPIQGLLKVAEYLSVFTPHLLGQAVGSKWPPGRFTRLSPPLPIRFALWRRRPCVNANLVTLSPPHLPGEVL